MMAAHVGVSRIIVLAALVTALAAVELHLVFSPSDLPALPPLCNPIPSNMTLIGEPVTVAQTEAVSLAEMRAAPPQVPRVPFGNLNVEWVSLKKQLKPDDRLYRFRSPIAGGHVAIRQGCVVGQITEWIR